MSSLQELLIARIRSEGPMPFEAFMRECLYHPQWGYYASGRAQIGREGDYFTSVSVGPLLGKLLAVQFYEMWQRLGCPAKWDLVEQGAFDGQLARDVLDHLRRLSTRCSEATGLVLIEPLADLRARQHQTLAPYASRTRWFESLSECPSFTGVHYSNELLDAFPVSLLRRMGDRWRPQCVDWAAEAFTWVDAPADRSDPGGWGETGHLSAVGEPFLRETCTGYAEWTQQLAARLERGWCVVLDYGLTEFELALPHRSQGTLTGYRTHQRVGSVLDNPGEQDITHQVNFTAVCEAALRAQLAVVSYSTQAQFLTPLGMLHFSETADPRSPERSRESGAFRTLTHPEAMGHRFKALILSTPCCKDFSLTGARFGGSHGIITPARAALAQQRKDTGE